MPGISGIEVLRRSGGGRGGAGQPFNVGGLKIDPPSRSVRCLGQVLELTEAAFNLLETLAQNAGRVVSRQDLSEQGLGRPLAPYDRSVNVPILAIRQKIGAVTQGPSAILNLRGQGYQLVHA